MGFVDTYYNVCLMMFWPKAKAGGYIIKQRMLWVKNYVKTEPLSLLLMYHNHSGMPILRKTFVLFTLIISPQLKWSYDDRINIYT
jgi:hypothetical protein